MDLSQYVNQLREDLASASAAGDEQTRRTGALLGAALEPAARLTIMNALSDLAAEVTAALGDRVVEVRLDGRDVRVAAGPDDAGEPEPQAKPEEGSPWGGFGRAFGGGFGGLGPDGGDISRVTLRLVEQMKNQAEQAAAQKGMSLNSWVAQAVQGALAGHDDRERPGKRDRRSERQVKGWVQG